MRTPNLNSLKMFDAAARHSNFRLAAVELNLTQGAVAQQVRKLEADLGKKLFHRKARGLELTEVGQEYHTSINEALHIINEATNNLLPERTYITISVTPSFAAKWLVPRLARFEQAHPDIEIRTVASEELANFKSDDIDLAIRQGKFPSDQKLQAELLAPMDLCAVCSPEYAKDIHPIKNIEEFTQYRLIQDSHLQWDRLFAKSGISAKNRTIQINQTALAMDTAAQGQGIVLAPRLLVADGLNKGIFVKLWSDPQEEQSGYYLVYPKSNKPHYAMESVVAWIFSEMNHP